ncbi:MAG: hypothetical protein F9K46_18805 [Anaerolineae bacterium]|nr:MAG: hypothetical protein F9K46_18805 [Anaerolineae bacterium]
MSVLADESADIITRMDENQQRRLLEFARQLVTGTDQPSTEAAPTLKELWDTSPDERPQSSAVAVARLFGVKKERGEGNAALQPFSHKIHLARHHQNPGQPNLAITRKCGGFRVTDRAFNGWVFCPIIIQFRPFFGDHVV